MGFKKEHLCNGDDCLWQMIKGNGKSQFSSGRTANGPNHSGKKIWITLPGKKLGPKSDYWEEKLCRMGSQSMKIVISSSFEHMNSYRAVDYNSY